MYDAKVINDSSSLSHIPPVLNVTFITIGSEDDWHYLLGFYGILVIVFTPLLLFLPESPKYLFIVKSDPEMAIQGNYCF